VAGVKCPKCHFENTGTSRYCADCGTSLTPVHGFPPPYSPPAETQTLPPFFELETGTLFAERFQVIEKLGMGGMGRVYKVYDTKIKEKIALKLLKPEITFEEKTVERFRSEIRLARRIAHKNVCRMFDWGEFSRLFYITMEYVPGENLKNIIRMSGPLHVSKAVNYAKQICEGLAEAHRWDIVHRDLKPHNIMIDPTGTVRIMDFGIARSVQTKGWTGEGIAVGTPEYMSPEQAEGQDVDKRTDVYSLGIILYEMITGKVPFEGETTFSILRKHELEPPIPPKEWNPQIPESLNGLILKCLEKKKERRYQNAEEVLSELDSIRTTVLKAQRTPSRKTAKSILPPHPSRLWRRLGIGLAVPVLAAAGYFLLRPKPTEIPEEKPVVEFPAKTTTKTSIAVLPFSVKSQDQNQKDLWGNFAEDVRTMLNRIGRLNVLWKPSCESIQDSLTHPDRIGNIPRDIKILEGDVQIGKDTVRVNVRLMDVNTESYLWSDKYNERLEADSLEAQDKVVHAIGRELNSLFGEGTLQASEYIRAPNVKAIRFVRQGRVHEEKYRLGSPIEDFEKALDLFKKAVEVDPDYWLAYLGLGNIYEARYVQAKQSNEPSAKDYWATMIKHYQEAYAKNSSSAEVWAGLGWASFHQEDFDSAYARFKKALELDPNSPEVNFSAAAFLRSIGLDEKALKFYRQAIDHDPLNYDSYNSAALCAMHNGKYQEAAAFIRRALDLEPESIQAHLYYARILIIMRNLQAAESEVLWLEKKQPKTPDQENRRKQLSAWLYAARGEREKSLALIKDADTPYRYDVTSTYSLLGMTKEAIQNIKFGNEHGFQLIQDYLYPYPFLISNPYFDNLRNDRDFQEVVKKEMAKFEEKTKRYGGL